MIVASIANALGRDRLQVYFVDGAVEDAAKPTMKMEQFTAG